MNIDSGADHTVVRADLITEADYTGGTSRVGDYSGYWRDVPMAEVWLGIGKEYKFKHKVLVVPRDCPHEVLLGNDLEMFDELYELARVHGNSDPQVKAVTRGEAKRQRENTVLDSALDAKDGAKPVQCHLGNQPLPSVTPNSEDPKDNDRGNGELGSGEAVQVEVEQEEVSVLEKDAQGGERVEVVEEDGQGGERVEEDAQGGERVEVVEGDVQEEVPEEYDEGAIVDGLVDGDIGADIPLPDMTGGEGEREKLIAEQRSDQSLKELWEW